MKRIAGLLLALVLCSALLGGCAGDDSNSAGNKGSSSVFRGDTGVTDRELLDDASDAGEKIELDDNMDSEFDCMEGLLDDSDLPPDVPEIIDLE
jgi:predicted small secreted protein